MSNDEVKDGPQYDTEYQSEDADIRIISSDDVEFKVHSYQLQAASSVFRSMIALRQDGTEASDDIGHKIELTDPDLEIASNIGLFLDVLYGRELDLPDSYPTPYLSIGTLLRKYDCEAGLHWWRLTLRAWSTDPDALQVVVFAAAAKLDEVGTCGHCIRTCTGIWGPEHADRYRDPLSSSTPNANCFDFAHAGIDILEDIPFRYILAVLRAWAVKGSTESMDVREVRNRVADEFERLIKSAEKGGKTKLEGMDGENEMTGA